MYYFLPPIVTLKNLSLNSAFFLDVRIWGVSKRSVHVVLF